MRFERRGGRRMRIPVPCPSQRTSGRSRAVCLRPWWVSVGQGHGHSTLPSASSSSLRPRVSVLPRTSPRSWRSPRSDSRPLTERGARRVAATQAVADRGGRGRWRCAPCGGGGDGCIVGRAASDTVRSGARRGGLSPDRRCGTRTRARAVPPAHRVGPRGARRGARVGRGRPSRHGDLRHAGGAWADRCRPLLRHRCPLGRHGQPWSRRARRMGIARGDHRGRTPDRRWSDWGSRLPGIGVPHPRAGVPRTPGPRQEVRRSRYRGSVHEVTVQDLRSR